MTFFGGLFKGLAAVVASVLALGFFAAAAGPTASFTMTPDGNPVVGQVVQFTDTSTGSPTSWLWNFGDGQSSTLQSPTHVYGAPGPFNVTLTATNGDGSSQQTQSLIVSPIDTLRLNNKGNNAFTVKLIATNQHNGNVQGAGRAIPQNDLFGYFSLPSLTGNPDNPEVFVKILDGTGVNGQFWVFYGHLTDLIYDITVTEVATGLVKTYHKDEGNSPGGFDTSGFHPTATPTITPTLTPTPPVTATPTRTVTPTPTVPALTVVNLVASDFQWDFDGGGDSFTFHVGRAYQLRVSRDSGTQHQFSGIPAFSCSGSSLSSTQVCNFTPTAGQIGTHGFSCTNSGCGSGHFSMLDGRAIVAP
jgi:PKD repeat protein